MFISLIIILLAITGIGYVLGEERKPLEETDAVTIDADSIFDPIYKDRIGYGGAVIIKTIGIDSKLVAEPGKSYPITYSATLKPIHEYCTETILTIDPEKGLRIYQEGGGLPRIDLNQMVDYHVEKVTLQAEKEVLITATLSIPEYAPEGKIPLRAVGIDCELPLLDKTEVDIIVIK